MALANKRTGLTWSLAGFAGVSWTQGPNNVAPLRLAKVQRIVRHENRWQMQVEVAGSSMSATLEIAVIAPAMIRLSVQAPRWEGTPLSLGLNFTGAGPFFWTGRKV